LVKIPLKFGMIQPVAFSFGRKIILKHFLPRNIKGDLFLENNQLDAPIPFNIFIYFQLSTCFEHVVLIIRRDQIISTQLLVIVTL
jgi:hypothetical protein